MEQRTLTAVTAKITTAQSRIRSELGNFPSGPTKFTVVHRRPVFFCPPINTQAPPNNGKLMLANTMCRFAQHPVAVPAIAQKPTASSCSSKSSTTITQTSSSVTVLVSSQNHKNENANKRPVAAVATRHKIAKPVLKRSLSADHLDIFQPVPTKRPFPVQIWFNNQPRGPRPLVATAFWLDSPLHDSQAFVYTKLLEASQARRYLQLQSKPRKYLHLTGGWIVAVNNPPPTSRKPELMLPPMTVKLLPPVKSSPPVLVLPKQQPPPSPRLNYAAEQPAQQQRKKSPTSQLPPPPPLISLRPPPVTKREVESPPAHSQEHPLELCKRRKQSDDSMSPPDSPQLVINHSAPSSPLNLAMNGANGSSVTLTATIKRKIALPPPFTLADNKNQHEPLDLASPSPTTVFNRMSLTEILSPASPNTEHFRRRLILVLQVLLGKRRLLNLGHPEVSVEDILARILKKADVVPAKSSDVRLNWLKFLRLCVKNEDAWKREGWDRKTPDAILEEIYMQGEK